MSGRARSRQKRIEAKAQSEMLGLMSQKGSAPGSGSSGAEMQRQTAAPQSGSYGHEFGTISMLAPAAPAAAPPVTDRMPKSGDQMQALDRSPESMNPAMDAPVQRQDAAAPGPAPVSAGSATGQAPIQRDGMDLPGGATIETVNKNTGAIVSGLRSISASPWAANADFEGRVGPLLGPAANTLSTVPIDFVETVGINVHWTGSIRFRIGTPKKIEGGGAADIKRTGGTSIGTGTTATTGSKDSASGTATATGDKGSASGTAGTESSRGDSSATTASTSTGQEASLRNNMERFEATLVAEITIMGELDVSGSDYINPFKWGMYAGEAMDTKATRKSGSVECGSVNYYISRGMVPGGSPSPVQKQSRMEEALGITDQAKANFHQAVQAQSMDPGQFSRAGATPLPAAAAAAAEQHHGTRLGNVNLIQGGQADAYCDTMNAAAFTTPGQSGGSDIFVHSNVALDTMRGQHTLQHEITHAVQQDRGQTERLNGLSGDTSQRGALEKGADEQANAILSKHASLLQTRDAERDYRPERSDGKS